MITRMNKRNDLAFLNFFRFVFAFSIMLWHYPFFFFDGIDNYPFLVFLRNLTIAGGNQAFLLISGMMFYLAYYTKMVNNQLSIKNFLIGRLKKLYPIATFTTLLYFAFALFKTLFGDYGFNLQALVIDLFFFGNSVFAWGYGNYNGPLYFLSLLLICYIVGALLMLAVKKKQTCVWFLIPLLGGFYLCNAPCGLPFLNNAQIGFGLYNFYLGFFFMIFLKKLDTFKTRPRVIIQIIAFALGCYVLWYFKHRNYSTDRFGFGDAGFNLWIWIPMFTGLYGSFVNLLFGNKCFKFIGETSFHMFLYHSLVIQILAFIIERKQIVEFDPMLCLWIFIIGSLTLSILSAIFFPKLYKACEKLVKNMFKTNEEQISPTEN